MLLFFDTETTGFMSQNKRPDHPDQAHVVQLAAQLVSPENETLMEFSVIVNPGVQIPKKMTEIHGIDNEMAEKYGIPPKMAVSLFMKLYEGADLLVAHNISFDIQVMETALARAGCAEKIDKPLYCTMREATNIVKAAPTPRMLAAGRTHWKSPNLGECIKHFFGEPLGGANNAMVDVKAARRIYFELTKPMRMDQ